MCCFDVPITVKDQVVKYMRHCLWRKKNGDVQAKGSALISWKKVTGPKNQGGLGVLDLDTQNKALLLKNLDKFYNNHDIPWIKLVKGAYHNNGSLPGASVEGSFWWKTHLKLVDTFKGLEKCNLGNGKSSLFWQDNWDANCQLHSMPHLVTYARNHLVSVREVLDTEFLEDLFHLPL
jgi:hypothetical protein